MRGSRGCSRRPSGPPYLQNKCLNLTVKYLKLEQIFEIAQSVNINVKRPVQ
jgi:hypothetical protein